MSQVFVKEKLYLEDCKKRAKKETLGLGVIPKQMLDQVSWGQTHERWAHLKDNISERDHKIRLTFGYFIVKDDSVWKCRAGVCFRAAS